MAESDALVDMAFPATRTPRSVEYKTGMRAALEYRLNGERIASPFRAGTAAFDAFYAGIEEGHAVWRVMQRLAV